MSIMMLLKRPNLSQVPDVTKTRILSSICIKFSFSKRKLTKIARETSEGLAFLQHLKTVCLSEISMCSASVIVSHAVGSGRVQSDCTCKTER